jgi:hypothetical protein
MRCIVFSLLIISIPFDLVGLALITKEMIRQSVCLFVVDITGPTAFNNPYASRSSYFFVMIHITHKAKTKTAPRFPCHLVPLENVFLFLTLTNG